MFGAITIGRSVALKPRLALQARIGPSWNHFSVYENFRLESANAFSLFGPGAAYDAYTYNVVERKTAGLYFGTSLALATDGFMGGTIGFSGNLTPVRSYFGFDIGFLIGRIGPKMRYRDGIYDPN